MKERYLCIKVLEANVFGDLSDGGDAEVWCQINWGGLSKNTRHFKRSTVNQIVYFKIPVPPAYKGKSNDAIAKFEEYMTEELQTKSEFQVTVWADTHQSSIHNMGSGKMCLSMLSGHNVKYED